MKRQSLIPFIIGVNSTAVVIIVMPNNL